MKKYFIRKTMIGAITATMLVGGLATSVSAAKPVEDMEEAVQEIDFAKTSFEDVVEKLAGDKASEIDEDDLEELKEIYDEFFETDEDDIDEQEDIKEEFADELESIVDSETQHRYNPIEEMKEDLQELREEDESIVDRNDYKRTEKLVGEFKKLYEKIQEKESKNKDVDELEDRLDELEDDIYVNISILRSGREKNIAYYGGMLEYAESMGTVLKDNDSYKALKEEYKELEKLVKNDRDLTDKEDRRYEDLMESVRENLNAVLDLVRVQMFVDGTERDLEEILEDYPEAKSDSDYKAAKKILKKAKILAKKEANSDLSKEDRQNFKELEEEMEDLIEELEDKC